MSTGLKILNATYGTSSKNVDVTAIVSSNIKDGSINLIVTPDSLGIPDPAPGSTKTLNVSYSINNGKANTQSIQDNGSFVVSAPPERNATGLEIRNGRINIKVGPSTAGVPDPNPNKLKTLSVQYELNGAANSVDVTDGKTLDISAPPVDEVDNKSPSQHAVSLFGMIYMAIGKFLAMFLYTLSIYTCMDLEIPTGFPSIALGAMGVVLPYVAFWGLPFVLFFRRLIYTTDLVI